MIVTIEEYNKTLEYQERMSEDVENIANKNNCFGDQYMRLLIFHILKQQNYFTQNFKTNVKIFQITLIIYQIKSKHLLNKVMKQGFMNNWL